MKILIIRTIQIELLLKFLKIWKSQFPKATFFILTHFGQYDLDYFKENFKQVFIYKSLYDFSPLYIPLKTLKVIRRQNFDLIIMPKKMNRVEGFENVLLLMGILNGKRWLHCSVDGNLKYISKWYLAYIFMVKFLTLFLVPFIYIIIVLGIVRVILINKFNKN